MLRAFSLLFFILLLHCAKPEEPPLPRTDILDIEDTLRDSIPEPEPVLIDLDAIKKRGTLIALSRYNANSFFIYKGQAMGYEYELLKLFAKELGVDLEVKTPEIQESLPEMLEKGEGDLIAANLAITIERSKRFAFSEPHNTTRQVLVQRLPHNVRRLKRHQIEKKLIRNPLDLIGKTVTVHSNSHYYQRIQHLSEEMGGIINIDTVEKAIEPEELIRMVSEGTIQYTIADENIASLNSAFYRNIDSKTAVGFPQRLAWAFRKESPALKEAADSWMRKLRSNRNPTYYVIYNKYYANKKSFQERKKSDFFSLETGNISPYDSLFKVYQSELFPWTMLASQAYQESQFNPKNRSWAGAVGLMQLLPTTAKQMNITKLEDPESSIKAGAAYLKYIHHYYWSTLPKEEAIKFTLASYNAGAGHIRDAQRVAKRMGLNENLWYNNVEKAVLRLSQKEVIYSEDVKYGYCRGEEPYNYVREILRREEIYKNILANVRNQQEEADTTLPTTDTISTAQNL